MRASSKVLLLSLLLFGCAQYVTAQSITITNPSFETFNTLTNTSSCYDWNTGPIPSWTLGASGSDGSQKSKACTGSPDFNGIMPDGVIYATLNAPSSGSATLSQTLSVNVKPDATYTFTFYTGRRLDGVVGTVWTAALTDAGTTLCSLTGNAQLQAVGSWILQTLTCQTAGTVNQGALGISFSATGTSSQLALDNLALSVATPQSNIALQNFADGLSVSSPISSTAAAPWVWTGPAGNCGTAPAATSTSGSSLCLGDSNGAVNGSVNGDAWLPITRTVGKGTATFSTTTIGAGSCSAVVSPALTAVASTDTIKWSYQTQPTAGTDAALDMQYWPTAGTGLNFKRCNNTSASINPTAIVINWEITR